MDALVERTGVSKTTMYKHWPSRSNLIAATVQALTAEPAVPDTGNIRDDLIALAMDSIGAYRGALWPVLAGLLEAAGHDAELRDALQSISATRFAAVRSILSRGAERGELQPGLDADLDVSVLVGAIFFRLRIAELPQVKQEVPVIVDTVLNGLRRR
jgi:AcrR family transcriptional regulator